MNWIFKNSLTVDLDSVKASAILLAFSLCIENWLVFSFIEKILVIVVISSCSKVSVLRISFTIFVNRILFKPLCVGKCNHFSTLSAARLWTLGTMTNNNNVVKRQELCHLLNLLNNLSASKYEISWCVFLQSSKEYCGYTEAIFPIPFIHPHSHLLMKYFPKYQYCVYALLMLYY